MLDAARMGGGLVAQAVGGGDPEAADTLEGPWDEAAAMPLEGSYAFLTGDRSLEVAYGTSSTDAAGAVRLSTIAVPRLAKAPLKPRFPMARKRRVSWLSVFYFLVILGALVGGSVWLDRKGEPVVAKVTSKTEEITVTHDPQGGWYRYFRVGAEFDAAGALMSATVTVDRARYDALHLGDSLDIRYLPILPLFARTPDRSTATVAAEAAHHLLGSRLLWWIGVGVIAMVIAARIGIVPIVVTGLFWMVAGYVLLLQLHGCRSRAEWRRRPVCEA